MRVTWWSGIGVVLVFALIGACEPAESALAKAIREIASHTGTTATEVEAGLRTAFRGQTDDQLERIAARTANDTAWIDAEVARLAAERVETRKAIASATCDWLQLVQISTMSDDERNVALEKFIVGKMTAAGMSESQAKSGEIRQGIIEQLKTYETTGTLDIPAAVQGSACFLFT
jgi:hypothetical protein